MRSMPPIAKASSAQRRAGEQFVRDHGHPGRGAPPDHHGNHGGHRRLHVAGADSRPGTRRTNRPVFFRSRAVRAVGMPFTGATPGEICGAFLHQQPKPPSQVIPHLVMQGSPFEVKSAFCRRLPLASCAKLLGIRASRRFDGFAARHSPGTKKL